MYNKITNPLTGRKVNIASKLGKKILAYYIYQSGGANFCSFNEKTGKCYKSNKPDPKGRCIYSRKTKRCKKCSSAPELPDKTTSDPPTPVQHS